MGGIVSVHGRPAVTTYDETTAGLLNTFDGASCWSIVPATPPGQQIVPERWDAAHFTLSFDSVGAPVATNLPASNGNFTQVLYPVHGSFRADCPAVPGSGAHGVVTLDATF